MPEVLTDESLTLSQVLTDPTLKIVAHLGKTTIDVDDPPVALNQLTECDFPGYARVESPAFDVFQTDDPNSGEAVSDPLRFTAGVIVAAQMANCLYLTLQRGSDPVKLWQVFPLANPWQFDVEGRSYASAVRLRSVAEMAPLEDNHLDVM